MTETLDEKTLVEDERRELDGCVRCGLWDRDEDGRLMCVCDAQRYAEFHPEIK